MIDENHREISQNLSPQELLLTNDSEDFSKVVSALDTSNKPL